MKTLIFKADFPQHDLRLGTSVYLDDHEYFVQLEMGEPDFFDYLGPYKTINEAMTAVAQTIEGAVDCGLYTEIDKTEGIEK